MSHFQSLAAKADRRQSPRSNAGWQLAQSAQQFFLIRPYRDMKSSCRVFRRTWTSFCLIEAGMHSHKWHNGPQSIAASTPFTSSATAERCLDPGRYGAGPRHVAGTGTDFQTLGKALKAGGDLLLYGCDIGNGDEGLPFLQQISTLTGANIAASNNATGGQDVEADWSLEVTVGNVTSKSLELGNFGGHLAYIIMESTMLNIT